MSTKNTNDAYEALDEAVDELKRALRRAIVSDLRAVLRFFRRGR